MIDKNPLAQDIEQLELQRAALKESLRSANRRTLRNWLVGAPLAGACGICLASENTGNLIFAPVVILIIVIAGTINLWLVNRKSEACAELKRIEADLKGLRF